MIEHKKAGRPKGTFKNPVRNSSREYQCWTAMRQRCNNPKSAHFKWYGARGIKVCPQWDHAHGFAQFYADMGASRGLTIDRINNDGNYEPSNCRWATMLDQAQNKRKPDLRDMSSLRQRAIASGLPYMLVYLRVKTLGWTQERALATPKLPRGRQAGYRKLHCVPI